jgi:hypothetical protein
MEATEATPRIRCVVRLEAPVYRLLHHLSVDQSKPCWKIVGDALQAYVEKKPELSSTKS